MVVNDGASGPSGPSWEGIDRPAEDAGGEGAMGIESRDFAGASSDNG